MKLISVKTILGLSGLLLFSCNNEDFNERGEVGIPSDYISFGVTPADGVQTKGVTRADAKEYVAGSFVLRSADSADTLCVRTVISDGIQGAAIGEKPITRGKPLNPGDEFYEAFHVLTIQDGSQTEFFMNDDVKNIMITDKDPFGFNSLHYIKDQNESKALNTYNKPCIIISASGMMEAGRIKHHVANNVSDSRNTILIVGYCTPSSLGARIQQKGLKEISIFGIMHSVKAQIKKLEGFSGHGDYKEMIDYLDNQDKHNVKHVFLVHGELETQKAFKEKLREDGWKHISIPAAGETVEL